MPTPAEIIIPHEWKPRKDQQKLWGYLEGGGKRAVEVAHRRWGKDDVALHYTATAALQRVGTYWHMLPEYSQARKVIFDAINPATGRKRIDDAFPAAIRSKVRQTDMQVQFVNGSIWQLVGSDNYNSLIGSPPVGIVFSEYAVADPNAWGYLSPILEENNGWALFISTSRGNNHLKRLYDYAKVTDSWFAERLTVEDTPVFSPEQIESIRHELIATFGPDLGEALFRQEYFCSFEGAVMGAYFARQVADARSEGRITAVPYQPGFGVDTAWDLGVDDSMAIWFFQQIGKSLHVIDYYESSGYGLEHYAKVLREKGYNYANHYMPHDAAAREMSSGEIAQSRQEIAESLGIRPVIIVPRARNIDKIINIHIPAARNLIPLCWFDEKRCFQGLSALEAYRAEYKEDKKVLSNRPLHDWASHGASAFITYAVGYGAKQYRKVRPITTAASARNAWKARVAS